MAVLVCLAAGMMREDGVRIRPLYYEPDVHRLPDELRHGPVAAPCETRGNMNVYGESAVYQDARGRIHILSNEGHDTVYEDVIGVFCLEGTDGRLYAVQDESFRVGLADCRGNQLLPRVYAGLEASDGGREVTAYGDYGGLWIYEILDR